jgi:hypothetical protein
MGTPAGDTELAAPEPTEDTPDELSTLRKRLADQEAFIGRQSNELGELRQKVEAIPQTPQPQTPAPSIDEDTFYDALDENPARAVEMAVKAQDGYAFEQAMKRWHEDDSYAATQYQLQAQAIQLEQARKQEQTRYEEHIGLTELNQAYASFKQKHADAGLFEQEMAQVSTMAPHLLTPLQTGNLATKQQVFETLYLMAKGLRGGEPAQPVAPEGQPQVPVETTGTVVPEGGTEKPKDPLYHTLERLIDEETIER